MHFVKYLLLSQDFAHYRFCIYMMYFLHNVLIKVVFLYYIMQYKKNKTKNKIKTPIIF